MPSAPTPNSPATDRHPADDTRALAALLGEDAPRPWWRRPGRWLAIGALAALVAGGLWWRAGHGEPAGPGFVTEPVARGTLRLTVGGTGTLQPTRTVEVGSELSGTVARVLVDLNDRVVKGQVLVELDTAKFRDQVARSRATLAARQATVAQSAATVKEARNALARYEEVSRLSGGKVPSKTEFDTARATLDRALADANAARAAVTDAQAALRTDETNLSKASIRSPIDGVVLTRTVDPGNAVAASLQAVTLFTIAEDLGRLTLEVNIDEADVGAVQVGQAATFTVSAWPNRQYPATIRRVAYGSTTTDNVVTYTSYLDVRNEDLSLRPGMTASATITATVREDVLTVPNTALRFTPSTGPATEAPGTGASGGTGSSGSILSKLMPRPPRTALRRPTTPDDGATHRVWLLRDGQPASVPVETGISDGRRTEVRAEALREGEPVIVDQRAAPRS